MIEESPLDPETALKRRVWSYRQMSRNMASQVAVSEDAILDCMRAAGDAVCPACRLEYIEHPQLANLPTFHLICSGKVVKL